MTSVESLFGHMDQGDRVRIANLLRESIADELRVAINRRAHLPDEEAVIDDDVSYIRQRTKQYDTVANWFESQ